MATPASATLTLPTRGGGGTRIPAPRWIWVVVPLAVLVGIFFYPLIFIAKQSLTGDAGPATLGHYTALLSSSFFQGAMLRTIQIAVLSTLGCLVLGFVLALIVSFVPFPGARLFSGFIDTILAFPSFLIALSFTFLYGSAGAFNFIFMDLLHTTEPPIDFVYTKWGVILAEITFYTPFVMRPLLAAFSHLDTALIEVASSLGARPLRIIREVIFPESVPALLAGGSLCLLLTLNEFGIVLFIGAKGVITLPMVIYGKAIQEFDYTAGCVAAVVNIVLSVGLYSLYRYMLSRTGGGRASVL
ncbi:MAG TPA: 2-aminoethylphosphonate ABC transporter permease subunit [Casimicrobiaceae bacterium]|nr:2-aminoethylphosphonate ABC transporter permease subunit [Casimicrobiaceae bacterium]